MVDERDGDRSHGRVQTCDAVIKRGGTAAPASLRHICEVDTITACGACTHVGAIYRQHMHTHAVDASRWVASLISTGCSVVAIPGGSVHISAHEWDKKGRLSDNHKEREMRI